MDQDFRNYGMPQQVPPRPTRPQQMTRQQYVNKRKKRRKAMMLRARAILAVLVIVVGLVLGAILLFKGKSYAGTFERDIDITDRVASDIAIWLSDIDDMEIDSAWVKSRVEPYVVTEVLTLSDDDAYSLEVGADSYAKLTAKVNGDLDALLTEIIRDKLVQRGFKEEVSNEEAAQITKEVLGMSASEYLQTNGISLVPDKEEIIASKKGTFSMRGNKITIDDGSGSVTETIIKKKGTLVFTDSGRVYNEKQ